MTTKSIYCIYPWDTCSAELSGTVMEWVGNHNAGLAQMTLEAMGLGLKALYGLHSSLDDEDCPTELKVTQRGRFVLSIKMHPVCEIVEAPENRQQ